MELAFVTGVSKGLGYSISEVLAEHGIEVIGLSRNTNEMVKNLMTNSKGQYTHISADLINVEEIESLIKRICQRILAEKPQKLYVINNASIIEPIERLGFLDNHSIQQAVHLNLLAPMLINNTFLKELRNEDIELVIVNVTSGAAERPIHGWNVYNGTKAAINMHTKVAGLEQENIKGSHKIIAFNPGLMDTDMQGTIRGAEEEAFTEINKFLSFKTNGDLRQPSKVASALVDLILNENLMNGKIYSVNELL
ncbi:SDR family NAD(P)-dependent oxidoreductase [Bacillus sp. 03113]|uniref:SDR family NAD(P)-dependent oxidoreductase n=1 Tax=Bacillus sp. 03113 TaxID=2578211 RepID=UPI0011427189|nr:SDR family NAD(P)-dependent oxidoreductase [Bacillus sp. 03113]